MRRPIVPPRRRSRLPSAPALAVIIGGLGFLALWFLVEPPDTTSSPEAAAPAPARIGPGPASPVAAAPGPPPAPSAEQDFSARAISGGEAILPAPEVTGPLTRIDPPRPPAAEKAPEPLVLTRVQVDAPGTIRTGKQTIRLAGIRPPDLDRVCTDPEGRRWPCGVQSRSALRAFIGTRRVTCTPPVAIPGARPDEASATCALGTNDISEWMVRQGWAEPAEDAPEAFAGLADTARRERLGLWRAAPELHAPITPPRTMPDAIGTPVPVEAAPAGPAPAPPAGEPAEGPPVDLVPAAPR